jgi:DNA-directed RNA polymerase III subunit RPC1
VKPYQYFATLYQYFANLIYHCRFSFGIGDVWPSEPLNDQKKELMRVSYETCSNFIGRFEAGDPTLLDKHSSSSSLEEALEFKLTKVLNEVRSKASAILTEGLHWNNTALNMYSCKSKGSKENIAQMTACVGQQAMGSSRIPDGFLGRSLPHFPVGVGSKYPDAKGFVKNSFFSGLHPLPFYLSRALRVTSIIMQVSPQPSFFFTL